MAQKTRSSASAPRWSRRQVLRGMGVAVAWTSFAARVRAAAPPRAQFKGTAEPSSHFLDVNGARLHYLEWGYGSERPVLVLLHPGLLSARMWQPFAASMARDYRVIAPDARGFGESGRSASYDDDLFVSDLRALLTALDLRRPILCGNSMGGTLACAYASLYPEAVERLILVDTGPGEKPAAADAGPSAPPAGPPRGGPPSIPDGPFANREAAASQIPPMFGSAFAKAMVELNLTQDGAGQWRWKHDPAVMVAAERSMRDPRKWSRWVSVKCPTLVLRGERSPALSPRVAEQMVAENRNAILVVVGDAGHFIPIEQPEAFEAAVRNWLAATR